MGRCVRLKNGMVRWAVCTSHVARVAPQRVMCCAGRVRSIPIVLYYMYSRQFNRQCTR